MACVIINIKDYINLFIAELYQEMLNIQNILSAQTLATDIIQSLLPHTLNSQLNFDTVLYILLHFEIYLKFIIY